MTQWSRLTEVLGAFVRRRVPRSDADDVLQEALLRIHRGRAAVLDEERLDAWLFRVTRSAIVDHYRRRRTETAPLDEEVGDPSTTPADDLAASTESEREALVGCLRPFIELVSEPSRALLTRVDLEGERLGALAVDLGLPLSTAKSRVQRGRAQVKQALETHCSLELDARGRVISCAPKNADAPGPCGGCAEPSPASSTSV